MPRRDEPSKVYDSREHVLRLTPPPSRKFAVVEAVFSVEGWPARGDLFEVFFDRSVDNGASWLPIGSAVCGPSNDHDGNPKTTIFVRFSVLVGATPAVIDQDGEIRIRLNPRVSFRTAISIETKEKSELPAMRP